MSRETYGVLDALGDVGGLYDALRFLVQILLIPLTNYAYQSLLLNNIFNTKSDETDPSVRANSKKLEEDLF